MTGEPGESAAPLPDPADAVTLDGLTERLRSLKALSGDPSFETIKERVNAAWTAAGRPPGDLVGKTTVVDCFRPGRRRLNADLVIAVVRALRPDPGHVERWRQALRVIGGETGAAAQVRVHDVLPPDTGGFTGRDAEVARLREIFGRRGTAVIAGMAGVGKTRLAVHAAHLLTREHAVDRVLFVDLRGFHPDPAQPPADPSAVLAGFLRLLGLPGAKIPHDLAGRAAAFGEVLAGVRALVVLDNAADAGQVRPLLPEVPGCPVLVTSRRSLTGLHGAVPVAVDVFTPPEAVSFLTRALPGTPAGEDPEAAARIAGRCGHLPLALELIAGHIRARPGWTLTDHAGRLDERHDDGRLDTGVELALALSYRHLPADRRRLLRFLASHPGEDFDAYAAAALTGSDPGTARTHLAHLHADHLLRPAAAGRYALHDLVRAFAVTRAHDEDRRAERRAALDRLFDHYLAAAAAAMDTLHPGESHRRPRIAAGTLLPPPGDPDAARAWLDTERANLVAVAVYAAAHGWPTHTTRLSRVLFRYLAGGHQTEALVVHGQAHRAALRGGDPAARAHALADLGVAHQRLGRYGPAGECLRQALDLFAQVDDPAAQARALGNLGLVEDHSGHQHAAADHHQRALALFRQAGDRSGEARALTNLGIIEKRLGRTAEAADHLGQALRLARLAGDRAGEAVTLNGLGDVATRSGRYARAGGLLRQALALYRSLGHRDGEAWTLDSLGILHTRLGRPGRAAGYHRRALAISHETGDRYSEAWSLNGLGEAAHAAGRPGDAVGHHRTALGTAEETGDRQQQARAHRGLGDAWQALGDPARARDHRGRALVLYTGLGMPEAGEVRDVLDPVAEP